MLLCIHNRSANVLARLTQLYIPRHLVRLITCLVLTACSSVSVKEYREIAAPQTCSPANKVTAIWGSAWRADQKERELRERIISESLGVALRNHPCIQSVKLHPRDSNAEGSSTLDSSLHETDVVLFFLFEEAGPNLSFYLSPILWDTNNHVRYRLHAIDTKNSDAVFLGAIDWRRGGPFTFNSTAHLDADIQTAVTYALDRVFDNPDDTESGEHRVQ